MKPKNIVSFSGGKDSTAMLLLMLENNIPVDEVVFFDTGWEFPEMYAHNKKVEDYTGLKITTIHPPKSFDYYMFDHVKTKGKNKGAKGYSWADFGNRWCTTIKKQTINRYLKKYENSIQFVGIAFDELHRNITDDKRYPLIELQYTEAMALQYCYDIGFDWDGLYKLFNRVSCYNCPLKRIGELRVLYNKKPELWAKMLEMDKNNYRDFRSDYTLKQLTKKFEAEKRQTKLW